MVGDIFRSIRRLADRWYFDSKKIAAFVTRSRTEVEAPKLQRISLHLQRGSALSLVNLGLSQVLRPRRIGYRWTAPYIQGHSDECIFRVVGSDRAWFAPHLGGPLCRSGSTEHRSLRFQTHIHRYLADASSRGDAFVRRQSKNTCPLGPRPTATLSSPRPEVMVLGS